MACRVFVPPREKSVDKYPFLWYTNKVDLNKSCKEI